MLPFLLNHHFLCIFVATNCFTPLFSSLSLGSGMQVVGGPWTSALEEDLLKDSRQPRALF